MPERQSETATAVTPDATLGDAGYETESVMVVFKETMWENWLFAGGRLIHT